MIFSDKIYRLRKKEKMSQEEFAELFNVSRQAVQKWESGASLPELAKIIEISKYFGISIDSSISGDNRRMLCEHMPSAELQAYFEDIPEWEFYAAAMMDEYKQAVDEGLEIEQYKMLFEAISRLPQNRIKKEFGDVIQKIILTAPIKSGYKYIEPSHLSEIKDLRKELSSEDGKIVNLKEKLYGAWMGRICGCMLGKTVEGIKSDELTRFLKETNNFPLNRYINRTDLDKVNLSEYSYDFLHRIYADEIDCMPVDDDTNYVVLAQLIFDEYGEEFTPDDVASAWLRYQPKDAYCTAERVAFCNFVKGYRPPQSAVHKNPYREWIGAQIRGDYWGYINPGNPENAAEMAWRDASISHVKNGIYGEMFVSAMIASAAQSFPDVTQKLAIGSFFAEKGT